MRSTDFLPTSPVSPSPAISQLADESYRRVDTMFRHGPAPLALIETRSWSYLAVSMLVLVSVGIALLEPVTR